MHTKTDFLDSPFCHIYPFFRFSLSAHPITNLLTRNSTIGPNLRHTRAWMRRERKL
jgi:hypothetical protein